MSSSIEWTQETWNPLNGCHKISPGCENCYAMSMSWRLMHIPAMAERYAGTVYKTAAGKLNWTGVINMNYEALDKPLQFKKPTVFFVNSMSDLFHKDVPYEYIDRVFEVMHLCPQHIGQIITKRADRMLEYYSWKADGNGIRFDEWPLRNVWQGVSVEDIKRKFRIEYLRKTNAAIRFLSIEPLLEDIGMLNLEWIHLVIVGGESGHNARPMHPDWVRSIRDQCKAAGVMFFFKQWGEYGPGTGMDVNIKKHVFDDGVPVYRYGKHVNGRQLDGQYHDDMPGNVLKQME